MGVKVEIYVERVITMDKRLGSAMDRFDHIGTSSLRTVADGRDSK